MADQYLFDNEGSEDERADTEGEEKASEAWECKLHRWAFHISAMLLREGLKKTGEKTDFCDSQSSIIWKEMAKNI